MSARRKTAPLAALALALCAAAGAGAEGPSKLDARLRLRRAREASALRPAGAAPPAFPLLLRLAPGADLSALRARHPGAGLRAGAGGAAWGLVPEPALEALAADPEVLSLEAAQKRRPGLDAVRSTAAAAGLYLGVLRTAATDLSGLSGAGVVLGFVDTGIDHLHADFFDEAAGSSRILAVWDQTDAGGPSPAPYGYGSEWTRAQLTAAALSPPGAVRQADRSGHGTHVASIAAGDGSAAGPGAPAGTYKGLAPGADIVMVKTTFLDDAIADGMAYIAAKAAAAGKRAVINLSLGGAFGPHDGTSAFETAVSAIAASTPVFVSLGNARGTAPHARASVGAGATAAFSASFALTTGEGSLEFWHPGGDAYRATVSLAGISGTVSAVWGASASGTLGGHAVTVDNAVSGGHPAGDRSIFVTVSRSPSVTAAGVTVQLQRTSSAGSGRVDGYADSTGEGLRFTTFADDQGSLSVPATAGSVFPVGSYASKISWNSDAGPGYAYATRPPLGGLSDFSAHGPTRDGRQAPELAAPGEAVGAALSSDPAAAPGTGFVLTDGKHRIHRGTSMAAPAAAGAAALRLQAQPGATVAELRAILRGLARTDAQTGAVPNAAWGYGKLTASPQPVQAPPGAQALALGQSSVAWSWGAVLGAAQYRIYLATQPGQLLAAATAPFLIQTGLPPGATAGILVRGAAGGAEGPGTLISTAPYAEAVAGASASAFLSSVAVSFTPCAPGACSGYELSASSSPDFSPPVHSSATAARAAAGLVLAALSPGTTWHLRLGAFNALGALRPLGIGTAFTRDLSQAPAGLSAAALSSTTLRLSWTRGGNPDGLSYAAELSTSPDFSPAVSASTRGYSADFSGLSPDASHYLRARAEEGAFGAALAAVTLAAPASPAAEAFFEVGSSSLAARWVAPPAGRCSALRVELSTDPAFGSAAALSLVASASSAAFASLSPSATYFARVGALNRAGAASWLLLGSTATARLTLSSAPVTAAGAELSLSAPFPAVASAALAVGPGALPAGTRVVLSAGISADLSAARAAAGLDPLGPGVGFEIDAGGRQPAVPVRLTLAYDPARIPPGKDPRRLRLARLDPASGTWVLVDSASDPRSATIVAFLDHFSTFAPFFVAAGASPSAAVIYPNPWEPGGSGAQAASAMTFASLPDGARVRLLTLSGELVWEATAGPSGVLSWDGRTRGGREAASGVYYALIEGGGSRALRRAALVR